MATPSFGERLDVATGRSRVEPVVPPEPLPPPVGGLANPLVVLGPLAVGVDALPCPPLPPPEPPFGTARPALLPPAVDGLPPPLRGDRWRADTGSATYKMSSVAAAKLAHAESVPFIAT